MKLSVFEQRLKELGFEKLEVEISTTLKNGIIEVKFEKMEFEFEGFGDVSKVKFVENSFKTNMFEIEKNKAEKIKKVMSEFLEEV